MAHVRRTVGETRDESGAAALVPGIVVVFEAGAPALRVQALQGDALVIGRAGPEAPGSTNPRLEVDDERVSRDHAEVRRRDGRWHVRDLGSRNGTSAENRVVRVGHTVLMLEDDVRRFAGALPLGSDPIVAGPSLQKALADVARAAAAGTNLLVLGESGTGKELAARVFHEKGPHRAGPKVDVNCAAIPQGIAESLLFGAKKGAYSGATESAAGYVQSAHKGVLFLDEVGDLETEVQAKLLRVLETKEVMPLGASEARKVDVLVCAATNRDLREAAASGRFRADLYYRLSQNEVRLPPLRERLEEIPWLLARATREVDAGLEPHAKLVEACLRRAWPGNVRELFAEARRAAHRALACDARVVGVEHLSATAGLALEPHERDAREREHGAPPPPGADDPLREKIVAALREHHGNVAAAARALTMHRNQLYRAMRRLGIGERAK
jgi:transcriptional regulator with GAF, ATPase, and Fis domain